MSSGRPPALTTDPEVQVTPRSRLLSLRGVTKTYGHVAALVDVSLDVHAGEVVALVGDNGAGKTTLLKTIAGVAPPDAGQIEFDGRLVAIRSTNDATELGIASVYQDLALCDNLSVAANLFLGQELRRRYFPALDHVAMRAKARDLLASLGAVTIPSLTAHVGMLSGGQRQAVAIARALVGEPRLVILDEPTAALGVVQTAQVLRLIRRLRDMKLGVVLVSHNMSNVFDVADRVVVLRLGRNAGEFTPDPSNHDRIVSAITGADSILARS